MTYIEPITDPEILKLGFGSMALYREKKPAIGNQIHPDLQDKETFDEGLDIVTNWQQSFIAYLKEPGFKVGELAYTIDKGQLLEPKLTKTGLYYVKNNINLFTHYYPGQEWDGDIKYVREVKSEVFRKEMHLETFTDWQEVEEPAKYNQPDSFYINSDKPHYNPTSEYTQFQEEIKQGKIIAEINT